MNFEKDDAVHAAVAGGADEIRQLKATALTLRQELQHLRSEKDEAVQAAVAEGAAEIRQLTATVQAMRQELELLKFDSSS